MDTVQRDVVELPIVGRPLRGKRRKVGLLEAYVAQASTVREFTRMRDVLRIEIDADECAVRIERCQQAQTETLAAAEFQIAERRSEERRVGKECGRTCRSRGSPDTKKK